MRNLKAEEKSLWRCAVGSVRPLKRKRPSKQQEVFLPKRERHQEATPLDAAFALPLHFSMAKYKAMKAREIYERELGVEHYGGKRGSLPSYKNAQATLDLHGYTLQEAFGSFVDFVQKAARLRLRCVHIITGVGPLPDGGVLRHEMPRWLDHPKVTPFILSKGYVQKNNPGAVYLLLKARI